MQLEVELSFETQMFAAESGVCNGRQMQREQLHFVGNSFFRAIPLFSFSPAWCVCECVYVCAYVIVAHSFIHSLSISKK